MITVTRSDSVCMPLGQITLTSDDSISELASSLSGDLTDYNIDQQSDVITIQSIEEHWVSREKLETTEQNLQKATEELRVSKEKLETTEQNLQGSKRWALKRAQLYSLLCSGMSPAAYTCVPN